MYNVLIVDDEAIFRDYLKTVLEWEEYGLQITGEAKNGKNALEYMELNQVDIALVDISMPIVDGMEFSKRALLLNPDLIIILVTGHGEFQYAKQAIKIGVKDYILKPFDKDELESAIIKAVEKVKKKELERNRELKQNAVTDHAYANLLIGDLLIGDMPSSMKGEAADYIERKSGGQKIGAYRLVVVEKDFAGESKRTGNDWTEWKNSSISSINKLLNNKYRHITFIGNNGEVISILLFEDMASAGEYRGDEFSRLSRASKVNLGFSLTCALSQAVQTYEELPLAYQFAEYLMQHKLQFGVGTLLTEESGMDERAVKFFPKIPYENLQAALKNGNDERVSDLLKDVFDEIKENQLNLELASIIYIELISICLSFVTERGIEINTVYGNNFAPFLIMKNSNSAEASEEMIANIYSKALKVYTDKPYRKSSKLAVMAEQYILKNYTDKELTVEGVAGHLYINSSYLRMLFKQEYGIAVSQYIIKLRMEKARELIARGDIKLTGIAEMVGINDPAYFSKCFKKYYGIAPSIVANITSSH